MSVSFSRSGGAFVITSSTQGIVYSGDAPINFKNTNGRIDILAGGLGGSGNPAFIGGYLLEDITTIGGDAVGSTIDEAIGQLNGLLTDTFTLPAGSATSALQPTPYALSENTPMSANGLISREYPFVQLVAEGKINNHSWVIKSGRNIDVDTASVPEDLWNLGGTYAGFPTSGSEILQVSSSSASDTGVATALILTSDTATSYTTTSVTLQGTTWVDFPASCYRMHSAFYNTGTATTFNVGELTFRWKVTTSVIFSKMPVGTSQTYACVYTDPFGSKGYLYNCFCGIQGSASSSIDAALWIRLNGSSPRLRRNFTVSFGGTWEENLEGRLVLPALSDITIRIISASANNLVVIGGFSILVTGA